MKKYERVGQLMIRPLLWRKGHAPFDLARLFYAQYNDLNFEMDLYDYLRNGYVYSSPTAFGMIKPIEHEGRRGWYFRVVVGEMGEIMVHLPCKLDFIAFCRNNDPDSMTIIDHDAFFKKLAAMHGYKEREAA